MQLHSNATRERILSTSYDLFSHQGYESTGVALICQRAQISKGAFYHHFPSKKDVFLTLIEDWVKNVESQFSLIKNEPALIPDQFRAMIPAFSTVFAEAENIPIFLEFWLQAIRDPEIAERVIKPYFTFIKLFEKMFEKGISENSISPNCDPHQSMRLVIAFSLGLIMQSMIEPNREDWQKVSQFSLETVLQGLKKELA